MATTDIVCTDKDLADAYHRLRPTRLPLKMIDPQRDEYKPIKDLGKQPKGPTKRKRNTTKRVSQ